MPYSFEAVDKQLFAKLEKLSDGEREFVFDAMMKAHLRKMVVADFEALPTELQTAFFEDAAKVYHLECGEKLPGPGFEHFCDDGDGEEDEENENDE